jgi:c-di-GMP-binding flagellar brake protein YcgR
VGSSAIVKLGDRVQIKIGDIWYNTIVERLSDDSSFYISCPISKEMRVLPEMNGTCLISVTNTNGIYEFDVLVTQIDSSDNVLLIGLKIASEPRKIQRRNAFRINVMVGIRVIELNESSDAEEPGYQDYTKTLNLSELGMLFLSKKSYAEGAQLKCDIFLDKFGFDMVIREIIASVVRCEYTGDKGELYKIGVSFDEIPVNFSRALAKFIMRCQRINQ